MDDVDVRVVVGWLFAAGFTVAAWWGVYQLVRWAL